MKIYFAGSIRGGRDDKDIYLQIIELLKTYGDVLTEHIGNSELTSYGESISDEFIYNRDMKWLNGADVVVAEVTTPSLGVGYEIGKAESNKPVLCIYRKIENKRVSAMLAGNSNLLVKEYSDLATLTPIFANFFKSLS